MIRGIQLFFEFFPEDFQNRFALIEREPFNFIDEFGGGYRKGIVPRSGQCPIVGASDRQQESPDGCRAGIMPAAATGGHYPA